MLPRIGNIENIAYTVFSRRSVFCVGLASMGRGTQLNSPAVPASGGGRSDMTNTNDNWDKCPVCGAPVMVDPQTSEREDCGQCASRQSSTPGWLGFWFIVLFLAGTGVVLYFSIRMLFAE
jgi:ribosomal protein S27AE